MGGDLRRAMMRFRGRSILALMGVVALTAIWLAALMAPTYESVRMLFNITVAVLLVASLSAMTREGPARLIWGTFALVGWVHLVFEPNHNAGNLLLTDSL